ncbi:AAA family ATPase [Leifsonia shinshuensis]|uniref:LuxR C-terminal-related transcriptional regulator n=1 Tax=Leifsonia shinshuensis TaxID=150026 RepID=UPI001F5086F3|nr:LuxR family transcriptional regulator [Leifsonia shinshuensis]MCI0156156.1 AAA family ATPase [Leifsonia shinshuensis]
MTDLDSTARPLIGRDRARETILLVAHRAIDQGGAVLVTGEPGLGKTALLADVAQRLDGWTVLRVSADSFESDLAYATVETLVRGLAGLGGTAIRPPAPDDDALTVGRLLLDAIDALSGPVCLIVDDAQWVDEPSARALRFVVRRLSDRDFLFTAATRPQQNSVSDLFEDLASSSVNHARIDLTPLTVSDTQELAEHILGHAVSRRTATRLTEATQGSPLLLSVLLGQLHDTFTQALHPAGWDLPDTAIMPLASAISAALEGADVSVRTAAEFVAVLRDPLPAPVVGTIAARLGERLDLPGAVTRGLVLGTPRDGVLWVEPAHALLADALAADLTVERRVQLHRVAADVLDGHRALRHRVEAADTADPGLVDELLTAALAAADQGRAEQAMSYARSAMHLATDGELERSLIELGLLAMRFRLHEQILDLRPAIETLPPSPARDAVLLELRTLSRDVPGALELALRLEAAPALTPDERAIRTHVAEALPKVLMAMGDFSGVLDHLDTGRLHIAECPAPEDVADPALRWLAEPDEHLVRLLGWALNSAAHAQRPDLFGPLTAELDELLVQHESPAAVDALVARSRVFILGGDIERARADLAKANELVRRFPSSWTAGFVRTIYAHILFLVGEWEESVTLADTAVALALDETDLSCWPIALWTSTLVRAGRGESEPVTERLRSAAKADPRITGSYDGDLPFLARAELARALGRPEHQLRATLDAEDAATRASTLGWLTYRVDALATLGRAADARAAYERCAAPGLWRPYYGSLRWLEGRVLEAEGRAADALQAYREAAGESPFPFPDAIAALDAGRLLAAGRATAGSGAAPRSETDRAEAGVLLERAAATFRRLGASAYLARAVQLLDALRAAGDTAPGVELTSAVDPLAPLTTRERQVAHALAAGMTNKEIAERLYVSVTTVNFHVRNILAKLGMRSRRELRALALPRRRPVRTDRPVKS